MNFILLKKCNLNSLGLQIHNLDICITDQETYVNN